MKEGGTVLYKTEDLGDKVTAYSAEHSTPLPKSLTDYHAASYDHPESGMLSSNYQSQLHLLLANTIGAKRVLEIGVFLGYSAMLWSHAVGPDGHVTGLEYSPEFAKHAEKALAAKGITNVEIIVGPAAETLPKVKPSAPYDLVFIDADKPGYYGYMKQLLEASKPGGENRLLRPGALILADNVLRRGWVADDSAVPADSYGPGTTEHLNSVKKFNDFCRDEPRLQTFLLPLWDGLTMSRLVD